MLFSAVRGRRPGPKFVELRFIPRVGNPENTLGPRCDGPIYASRHLVWLHRGIVDGVACAGCSAGQFAGTMFARQGLPQLLQGPLRHRVGGDVLMENSPCSQFQDHEYVKGAKSRADHNEEVTRYDQFGMVMHKGQPSLRIGCAHWAVT